MILREIIAIFDEWAPPAIAQSYDNVGLQVGDPSIDVQTALVALDLTPAVIDEADDVGADLIVTHHPLLFRPLRTLSPDSLVGAMALRLARSGIALVAAHTNLDSVQDGVSAALANSLELTDQEILSPINDGHLNLVVDVPTTALESVRRAILAAGAGSVGFYDDVAFHLQGTATFRPLEGSRPNVGSHGVVESVPTVRLEVPITRDRLNAAREAMLASHPYETPIFQILEPVEMNTGHGLGIVGNLPSKLDLTQFLQHVCRALSTRAVRFVGETSSTIRRVAVCGGAGRDLISAALRKNADAYVTADLGYHSYFETMRADGGTSMALVDAGHYETEAATEQLIVDKMQRLAPSVVWQRTSTRTSPAGIFVAN